MPEQMNKSGQANLNSHLFMAVVAHSMHFPSASGVTTLD
jgi:hypothetical protein